MGARQVQGSNGMPLTIELAAAQAEALGLAQLVDRLDDRFRLLVNTNRVAVARQRSPRRPLTGVISPADRYTGHMQTLPSPACISGSMRGSQLAGRRETRLIVLEPGPALGQQNVPVGLGRPSQDR